jgi:hypothetical protein
MRNKRKRRRRNLGEDPSHYDGEEGKDPVKERKIIR